MDSRAVAPDSPGAGQEADFDAVVLAGGRGSRLGGVSKGELEVGGRRLVDIAVAAAHDAGASRVVVVGQVAVDAPAVVVREEPPFGGPTAGLAAALPAVAASRLLLLACDLPRAADLVALLLNADDRSPGDPGRTAEGDGRVIVDAGGRTQWLAGLYRTAAVREALDAATARGDVHGLPLRRILEPLHLARLPDTDNASDDIDTPEQLAAVRRAHDTARTDHRTPPERGPAAMNDTPKHLPPEALDEWLAEVQRLLELDDRLEVGALLDVARDVAHNVARPAAPLTTFALGLALGRQSSAADSPEVFARLAELVTARAIAWERES